jgi:hypothetical protein
VPAAHVAVAGTPQPRTQDGTEAARKLKPDNEAAAEERATGSWPASTSRRSTCGARAAVTKTVAEVIAG